VTDGNFFEPNKYFAAFSSDVEACVVTISATNADVSVRKNGENFIICPYRTIANQLHEHSVHDDQFKTE
jgi:hypothetical protein